MTICVICHNRDKRRRAEFRERLIAAVNERLKNKEGKTMHDRNGNLVNVGDRVRLEGEITSTSATDEYCNVTVRITEKDQPHGPFNVQSTVVINAKQTEKIGE